MYRKLGIALGVLIAASLAIRSGRFGGPTTSARPAPRGEHDRLASPAIEDRRSAASLGAAPRGSNPQGRLRLEGQVLLPDGSGADRARVSLSTVPPSEVVAEADGSFVFERLTGRTYAVMAIAGDLIGGPLVVRVAEDSDPVVVRLVPGAALTVHVADDGGRPVPGAAVELVGPTARTVETDAAGAALVKPVRAGPVGVVVSAAGYATARAMAAATSAGATGELTITLHAGHAVSGRVIDEAGQPIAGAEVSVADGIRSAGSGRVETDAAGRFTVPALAAGSHTVLARDGEHAPAESSPIAITDRSIDGLEITMTAGGVIAGVVVAADTTPVASATVRLVSRSGRTTVRELTSDPQGRFEVRGLPRVAIHAQAESSRAASAGREIDLRSNPAARDVELVLDAAGEISGVVEDAQGKPVAEVQVTAYSDGSGADPGADSGADPGADSGDRRAPGRVVISGPSSATTDGSGAFSIRGLRIGAYRLFVTSDLPGQRNGAQGTLATTGARGVRIVLVAAGRLRGKLQFARTTRAPARAVVQLGPRAPVPVHDGSFDTMDVTPGVYDVVFRGDEFAELILRGVAIEAGKTTDLGTIDVPGGRTLVGRVVDERGASIAGARVRSADPWRLAAGTSRATGDAMSGIRSAVSDRDGRFRITGVASGATSVAADHAVHGRSIAQRIEDGAADPPPMTLVLRGMGTITGIVTMQGRPQAGALVTAVSNDGALQPVMARASADGTFQLTEVPAGEHVLSATQLISATSVASSSIAVAVRPGAPTQVTLELGANAAAPQRR